MTDSDEDYELPSLSERIQGYKLQNRLKSNESSESDSDVSEFLKFSEKLSNTPCPEIKLKPDNKCDSDESDESDFLKFTERIRCTPYSEIKVKSGKRHGSESEESDFEKFTERIRCTPYSQIKVKSAKRHDSESEESDFEKFSVGIRCTPNSQTKLKSDKRCDMKNEKSEFMKLASGGICSIACSQNVLKADQSVDSKNEVSDILKFSEKIPDTPCSPAKSKLHFTSDSEDESEFSKFSERIRNTPRTQSGLKQHYEDNDSDSDGALSNLITKFQRIHTPKSQNKYNTENSDSSHLYRSEKLGHSCSTDSAILPKQETSFSTEIEREFASLFPSRSDDSLFQNKRAFYTQTLYEFFNKKVFNYQLPKDMPLIWDGSLVKTAGLTVCKAKSGIYSCSIKLSSKLLTSFDRLQDTLIHEMCHAATWLINKKNVMHGPLWQIWASRCKLILPFIDCPARCHTYDIPYRFWYQCTGCNWKRGTCRRTKKYQGAICRKCKIPIIMTVNNS